jgi:RNA polymerase sigma factor (sigma-70 family)
MNELSDQELLREYAQKGSESAFAMLVQRHVDLVYSAARRMVVDPHLAQDVTQAVFIAAAREARKLQHCAVVSAWLHRVARNHAAMTVRGEVRRRGREQRIAEMTNDTLEASAVWDELEPILDDCVGALRTEDRDALVLRFFERRTARQIGERLGLTEDAAQKRVTRALEKLREVLASRGISTSSSALTGALLFGVVQAAPVSLATTVAVQAVSIAGTASVLTSTITFMASHKVQMSLLAAVATGLGGSVLYQRSANLTLREQLAAAESQIGAQQPEVATPVDNNAELERLRAEHLELLRLRGELTLLKQQARERETSTNPKPSSRPQERQPNRDDFLPSDRWRNVGFGTPANAFQSFLAELKSGSAPIESLVQWEVDWKENPTEEDIALVEKSRQDYIEMIRRGSRKIAGFELASPSEDGSDQIRLHFQTLTTNNDAVISRLEMRKTEGEWKPVLRMGWKKFGNSYDEFTTFPVFGPKIDLED